MVTKYCRATIYVWDKMNWSTDDCAANDGAAGREWIVGQNVPVHLSADMALVLLNVEMTALLFNMDIISLVSTMDIAFIVLNKNV